MTGHPSREPDIDRTPGGSLLAVCRTALARYRGDPRTIGYGGQTLCDLALTVQGAADPVGELRHYAENCGLLLTDGLEPEAIDLTDHPDYADALAVLLAGA